MLLHEANLEQTVDFEISLPDYFPEIVRILKCTLTSKIISVQSSGDRVTVDGEAVARMLYVCADGRPSCFEQVSAFSKYCEVKNLGESDCVSVRAKTEYVNCRAISGRKAEAHGALSVSFKCMGKRRLELVSAAEGEGIQLKSKSIQRSEFVGDCERTFFMSETVTIDESRERIGTLIRTGAFAVADEIEIINNKIMIKGELNVTAVYIAAKDETEVCTLTHSMPLNQILELDGVNDRCVGETELSVISLDVIPRTDAAGDLRLLDISASVSAFMRMSEPRETVLVTDAYSTTARLELQREHAELLRHADSFSDTLLCKESLDVSATGISKIYDLACEEAGRVCAFENGKVRVGGILNVSMLAADIEGQLTFLERQMKYEYTYEPRYAAESCECRACATVTAAGFVINSRDEVAIKAELKISGQVYETFREEAVIELEAGEAPEIRAAALTIYYPDVGESLWDIARRDNTTVSVIVNENRRDGEIINEKRMLLIPGM
ncbi:MAG: DUF3794 domain-containing protein [Clostridiales bacterium]|nr:DUF3794 domain-containing protein [Clostridiales bacterium]